MAVLSIGIDTKSSELGWLAPIDVEIAGAIADVFYLICRARNFPHAGLSRYDAEVFEIEFSNPLGLKVLFKDIPPAIATWVLDRTIFYTERKRGLAIENEKRSQEVLDLKIKNAAKLSKLRKQLIKDGLSVEEAAKVLAAVVSDQGASLQIEGPP
jgi:hypothetical protein